MSNATHRRATRARFAPIAIGTGALAAVLLSLTMTGTLSGFAATIVNSTNNAAVGSLTMQEVSGSTTCNSTDGTNFATNSATCATINKFGGSATLVPGGTQTTIVTIKNTGTAQAGAFTLTPGSCTQTGTVSGVSAADMCTQTTIKITNTTTSQVVFNGTATGLAAAGALAITSPPAGGVTNSFTFLVTVPSSLGNSYQGLGVAMPLTWQFTA